MAQFNNDFPFYKGDPVALRLWQWLLLMLAVVAGFAALYLPLGDSTLLRFVPPLLFAVIPLLALRALVGRHWRALFQRVASRDILLALGVALANLGVTAAMGLMVLHLFGANANPAFGALTQDSTGDRFLFALQTLPQLLGEELFTLLPFLGFLTLLTGRLGLTPHQAVVAAWLISSLLFGMAHLPTYDWHWAQCILIIGFARLVLSLAYFWTRNVWVSTLAHVINDWTLLATGLLLTIM